MADLNIFSKLNGLLSELECEALLGCGADNLEYVVGASLPIL